MDFFTLGKTYQVIAVYQVEGNAHLLLVDDLGHLANRLAYRFELDSKEMPEDWQINIVTKRMTIIIGPEFLIEYDDLAKLVEYDPEMMDKLKAWYMGED